MTDEEFTREQMDEQRKEVSRLRSELKAFNKALYPCLLMIDRNSRSIYRPVSVPYVSRMCPVSCRCR